MTDAAFAAVVRAQSASVLRLALKTVRTLSGARYLYRAEQAGLARKGVLRSAERRIAELRGEQAESTTPSLVAAAEAIDPERRAHEARVVAAVGRGRRHPRAFS